MVLVQNDQAFYERIGRTDAENVRSIVRGVEGIARDYFSSPDVRECSHAFCREGSSGIEHGEAFFSVYAIAGNITKRGERPDVDLLVVTNAYWMDRFTDPDSHMNEGRELEYVLRDADPLWGMLVTEFNPGNVTKEAKLPDGYNLGETRGKALIRIAPREGRRIDLCYVRGFPSENHHFISEDEFVARDVDNEGRPLERLLLSRSYKEI